MRLIDRASWFLDELGVTLAYRASMAGIRNSARAATEWTDRAMSMVDALEPVTRASVLTDVGTVEHVHGDGDPG